VLFVRIAAVALGFPLLSFSFGWAVLGRVRGLDPAERFTAAWGAGYAFLAAAQFLAFVVHAPQPWFHLGVVALMLAVAVLGRRPATDAAPSAGLWPLAGVCALAYLHVLCVQALLPQYVGSDWWGDWRMHYDEALVFAGRLSVETQWQGAGTYTLASRTPLFNLAAAFALSGAGDDFPVFQVAASALSGCFLPAVYLVLRDLFGERAGRLGLLLGALNLWLLHNAWFTWSKMLAAYFLVLGLYFCLRWLRDRQTDPSAAWRWFFLCWVSGLLGFLTHQVAAVYLGILVLHAAVLVVSRRAPWPGLRRLALLPAAALLLVGPWYAWLVGQFGLDKVLHSTPVTQMEKESMPALAYLESVASNLYASVVPLGLYETLSEGPATWGALYRGVTAFYFSLLPGALTLSLTLFLLAALIRNLCRPGRAALLAGLRRPGWSATWAFALLGAVGAAALHPKTYTHGIAHAALFPSVVVLAALAWGRLSQGSRPWAALVCAGMVAEFAAMFWSHVWLTGQPLLLDPKNINVWEKSAYQLVFLADHLAGVRPAVIAATVAVQLGLVVLLCRWLVGMDRPVPGKAEPLQNSAGRV
jgi:hypothetical protein